MHLFTLKELSEIKKRGNNERLIFYITEEEIQERANKKLFRSLADFELKIVAKEVESAFTSDLEAVLDVAIEDARNTEKQ